MIVLWCALASAEIVLDPPPRVAETSVITITRDGEPRAGATVRAILRPGLDRESEIAIGITDSRGRVRWTPDVAGVIEIRADGEQQRARVAWAGQQLGTAMILALLGALGLGATAIGWRRLTRRG